MAGIAEETMRYENRQIEANEPLSIFSSNVPYGCEKVVRIG
jgi:hypothetical protein